MDHKNVWSLFNILQKNRLVGFVNCS